MAALTPVLTVNSGSSSLKASLFAADGGRRDFRFEHLDEADQATAFDRLLRELGDVTPAAIGHRLVHGGDIDEAARRIDDTERARLQALIPLAPLHLPGNLRGVDACRQRFDVPQVACFHTAFHATLPELARRLPIPRSLGLRRYGFHGINYAHIAARLPALLGDAARGRVVVAHLGNGASLCLLENLRSVDTTMGYTPAGGIPMATRSGDLDPGVMLTLARDRTPDELSELVYRRMGLLALSDGESGDMARLLASPTPAAHFAVDYFCRQARAAIGAYAAKAGGIDALVLTGGIGEHAAEVRARICEPLGFLGLRLDDAANQRHDTWLSSADSKPVLRIAADEEAMIHRLVMSTLAP